MEKISRLVGMTLLVVLLGNDWVRLSRGDVVVLDPMGKELETQKDPNELLVKTLTKDLEDVWKNYESLMLEKNELVSVHESTVKSENQLKQQAKQEKDRADKAETALSSMKINQSELAKKVEEGKKTYDEELKKHAKELKDTKDEVVKTKQNADEIDKLHKLSQKNLEAESERLEATMKQLKDLQAEYDTVTKQLKDLQAEYDTVSKQYQEALQHLANPQLSEYLSIQGKKLGEMRPELQAAVDKARVLVEPHMKSAFKGGQQLYSQAKDKLVSNVGQYVGNERAQHVTVGLIAIIMILPAFALYRFLKTINQQLQLHQFVMCMNFWGFSFFVAILFSSQGLESDRDAFQAAQRNSPQAYVILQLCCAFFFVGHFLASANLIRVFKGSILSFIMQAFQVLLSVVVATHYYFTVWTPAMLDEPHQSSMAFVALYALVYGTGVITAYLATSSSTIPTVSRKKNVD